MTPVSIPRDRDRHPPDHVRPLQGSSSQAQQDVLYVGNNVVQPDQGESATGIAPSRAIANAPVRLIQSPHLYLLFLCHVLCTSLTSETVANSTSNTCELGRWFLANLSLLTYLMRGRVRSVNVTEIQTIVSRPTRRKLPMQVITSVLSECVSVVPGSFLSVL